MLYHYLSVAFRQLVKNKLYSAISVTGLAVGLASVFLIYQYLKQETSYDKFHYGAENIYRIAWSGDNPQTRTPHPMPLAMQRDFPEVENGTSLTPLFGPGLIRQTFSLHNREKDIRYDEAEVLGVDSTFFKIFTFPLIKGDAKTALKNPSGILISESAAKKYFPNEEPLGKYLYANSDVRPVEILGVFKDVPVNSHFHFDILVSYLRLKAGEPDNPWFGWDDFGHYNYVKLKPGTDAKALESRLMDWAPKYLSNVTAQQVASLRKSGYGFRLQPLTDIHLHSHLNWELETNGNISYVYMTGAAGLLILIIASLNFINLTTAQSTERAKEIGIRKSLGAFRSQLSGQFIGESMLIAFFGALLAVVMIEGAIPFYNSFTGNVLVLHYYDFIIFPGCAAVAAGFFAGMYPALYLSMIKPGAILKGKLTASPGGAAFRKSFMIFQFFASMVLISSSLIIFTQLDFVRNKSLGFNKDELLILPLKNRQAVLPRFEELQTELLRIPGVTAVSAASNIPGRSFNQNAVFPVASPDIKVTTSEMFVDPDFLKTMDVQLAAGRSFSRSNPADKKSFMINETAARQLYPDGAVGKEIVWDTESGPQRGTVIGVVKDFHYLSLHDPLRALLFIPDDRFNYVMVRTATANVDQTIRQIELTWKKFDDMFGFEFSFLSDQLSKQYAREQNMASVMIFFSLLAVIITCVGLLGIAALTFRQRTKEVSIRKVLGASLSGITWLLLRNFTLLVITAAVLAVPLVWWMMNDWLNNFTYRTSINPLIFALSGMLLIVVTWGTLGFLTVRIAKVNPAQTLRSE